MPYYSPSTNGFYDGEVRPEDAVVITNKQRNALLVAQYAGQVLSVVDGKVVAANPAEPTLDEVRLAVSVAIESWRDSEERAGVKFDFQGHQYDGGDKSRLRLQDSVASGIAASGQFFWTDEANEDVPMHSGDLSGLYGAMMAARVAQGFKIHVRQRQMKEEIATLDCEELQAYQVGWPEPPAEHNEYVQPA